MPPRDRQKLGRRSGQAIFNANPDLGRGRRYEPTGNPPIPPRGEPYRPTGKPMIPPFPMGQGNMGAFPMEQDNRGVMGAMANNPMVQQAKNLYNKIDPWIPDLDVGGNNLGYSFERPLLGGALGFGMDYGWDDEDIGAFLNWKTGLGA